MRALDIPAKFPIPFAGRAAPGFIRPIPLDSQIGITNGAASLVDGFPPETFSPVLAGGTPPWGADANGILNQTTAWDRYLSAGGEITYDPAFQLAIGGYPAGARVYSNTIPFLQMQSMVDDNMTSPDTGGPNNWRVPSFADPGNAAIIIRGDLVPAMTGANILFQGDGTLTTTPRKYIRSHNGVFSVVNDAYSAEIFSVSDLGDAVVARNLTAVGEIASNTGNVTAGRHLRAALGALNSGDPNAAALLDDFNRYETGNGFYFWYMFPDGMIIQGGISSSVTGHHDVLTFPLAFPNVCIGAWVNEANPVGGWDQANAPTVFAVEWASMTPTNCWIDTMSWNGTGWWFPPGVGQRWWALGW